MIHHVQGDYEKAVEYFGRCYEICTKLNDPAALHSARVQYGIAKGHQLLQGYSGDVAESSRDMPTLKRLLVWKDDRATPTSEDENVDMEETADTVESTSEETATAEADVNITT